MSTIQTKLRSCYYLASVSRFLLDEALELATDQHYATPWLATINDAIHANQRVWLATYRIATCTDPTTPPPAMPPCNLSTPREP